MKYDYIETLDGLMHVPKYEFEPGELTISQLIQATQHHTLFGHYGYSAWRASIKNLKAFFIERPASRWKYHMSDRHIQAVMLSPIVDAMVASKDVSKFFRDNPCRLHEDFLEALCGDTKFKEAPMVRRPVWGSKTGNPVPLGHEDPVKVERYRLHYQSELNNPSRPAWPGSNIMSMDI